MISTTMNGVHRVLRGRSVTDGAIQAVAAQAVVVVLNLLTGVLTARLLGPEGRGIFAAIVVWPMFFATLATSGLITALPVRLGTRQADRPALLGTVLVSVVIASCLSAALGAVIVPFILEGYTADVVTVAQLAMVLVVPIAIHLVANVALAAMKSFGYFSISRILPHAMYLVGLVLVWGAGHVTWASAVAAQAVGTIFTTFAILLLVARLVRPTIARLREASRSLFSFAARSAPADALAALGAHCDRLLLVPVIPAVELGYYVVAYGLSRLITMIVPVLNAVLLAKMTHSPPDEAKYVHDVAFRLALATFSLGGLAVAGAGRWLLVFLYGKEFAPVTGLFVVLVAEAVIGNLCRITVPFLNAIDRPGTVSTIGLITFLTTAAGVLVLAPSFGPMGAALALLGAAMLRLTLLLAAMKLVLGLALPRPWLDGADIAYLRSRLLPGR